MKRLSDYVNPYIGTISHMLTSTKPEVMYPYGMARSTPVVTDCGDYYCNDRIQGFALGDAYIMPGRDGDFQNTFDHSREESHCYYLRMELDNHDIVVESTVTQHVYLHRFQGQDSLKLYFPGGKAALEGDAICVELPLAHQRKPVTQYVYIKAEGGVKVLSQEDEAWVLAAPGEVVVAGAASLISVESAKQSYELEAAGKSFDGLKDLAQDIWDRQLSKIQVEGNTEEKKTVFYTAMYRAFQRMTDFTEYGRYFSGFDGKVHEGTFYNNDGLWDTFRCMHPLQLLVDTKRHQDILESYNEMYRESGVMPCFPGVGGDQPVMIGFHAASLFGHPEKRHRAEHDALVLQHPCRERGALLLGEGLLPRPEEGRD